MAIWWPSSGSSCRVDLLVASASSISAAIRCAYPSMPVEERTSFALDMYQQALALRAAQKIVDTVGPGIVKIISTANSYIRDELPDVLGAAVNAAKSIGLNAQAALQRDLADAAARNRTILDTIADGVSGFVSTAGANLDQTVDKVTANIGSLLGQASGTVGGLVNSAKTAVATTITAATNAVGSLVNTAKATIVDLASQASGFLETAVGNIGSSLATGVDFVTDGLRSMIGTVKQFIQNLVANVQTGIAGIVEKLTSIPAALASFGDEIISAFGSGAGDFIEGIGKFLSDPLEGIIGGFFHNEEPEFLRLADGLYDYLIGNPNSPIALRSTLVDAKVGGKPVPAIIAAIIIPVVLAGSLSTIMGPVLQPAVQWEMQQLRPTLLSLGDAIDAYFRGVYTLAQVYDVGAKSGFTDADITDAITVRRPQPTPIDIADWRHRGFIPDGEMVERLQQQGYAASDASMMLDASEVLPGIGDLVRFAVREAFAGQSGFGGARGSGVPQRFVEVAKMQGLDPEFARSYWAAHWELPSTTAVFSMYHRGLIDESALRAYLKEADFAPEWIDKIISVAYDPLTRVDVRRMRALDVLTKAQVEDAYRDLGYSPQNARRLADFVEADIADSKKVETSSQRDLTRADLVGAYADGVLNRSQAKTALVDLGYDANESELVLDREDIRQLRAERKETRSGIVDQVLAGVIDVIAAQDKLGRAGYTDDEITATVREIERKQAAAVRQPTKAELDRFRKNGILSDDEYAVELRRLGYAERWITAFVALGAEQVEGNG